MLLADTQPAPRPLLSPDQASSGDGLSDWQRGADSPHEDGLYLRDLGQAKPALNLFKEGAWRSDSSGFHAAQVQDAPWRGWGRPNASQMAGLDVHHAAPARGSDEPCETPPAMQWVQENAPDVEPDDGPDEHDSIAPSQASLF